MKNREMEGRATLSWHHNQTQSGVVQMSSEGGNPSGSEDSEWGCGSIKE